MKKISILLLSLMLVFTIFSVVSAQEVKNPDTFTYITISDANTLDPHFSYDTASSELIYQVYEGLIDYKGESVTEFKPRLATEVPSSENGLIKDGGKTYIFPLRQGVQFSNGNPLTTEDVKYSLIRGMIQDRSGGPIWMLYEPFFGPSSGITGFAGLVANVLGEDADPASLTPEQSQKVYAELERHITIDGNNVVMHLDEPYPPFLNILAQGASWGSVLDKEWCIAQGAWDGQATTLSQYHDPAKEADPLYDKMMGTGPFVLTEWVNGDYTIFKRNDDYWREPANFKTVVIKNIDEFSTRKLMLGRGDADMIYVPNQFISQVENMDNVVVKKGFPQLQNMVGIMNWGIVMEGNKNVGSGKLDGKGIPSNFFADENVRKAFTNSFNYQAFIDQVRMGNSLKARGPIVKPLLGFADSQPTYSLDLAKAEEYFKKAFDGELWEKGFTLTVTYNTGNDARKAACDILKTYVEQINPKFHIDVRGIQWSTYLDDLIAGKFTLGFMGWLADFPDPHNFVVPFVASYGTYGAFKGDAYINWAKENIDPLIEKGITTLEPVKREDIYKQIQKISFDKATDIWLDQPAGLRVYRDWVKGWYPNAMRPGRDFYIMDK